ncbi:MAG: PilZ domain-containing protein [Nitrospirae bacterium]|nr:PilZ domain-containing protein [Candidatus Manganitrophaceae bacterium]
MAVAPDDQRASKRVPFIQDVEVVGVGMRRAMDLSTGGMYIEMVANFVEGNELDLRFKLNSADKEEIRVRARVLYIHPGMGAGLRFLNLSPPDRSRIEKWISEK